MFDYHDAMDDLESLRSELEQLRRSLAMLPPSAPLTREKGLALVERCQTAVDTARRAAP